MRETVEHPTCERVPLKLWPHQTAAIQAARDTIRAGRPAGLWSMPTGCGKTRAFVSLAADLGWPTLVLVHRDELIRQTVDTFADVWPDASVGVVQGERNELPGYRVVVASVPSLRERRLQRIPRDRFALVVTDEAHHAPADTWSAVLDHFDARFILGCTATPERHDGKGLADRFGAEPIYSYPLRAAIEDGHLARPVQYAIETSLDLGGVTIRCGDFADAELSEAVNTPARNRVIVDAYTKHATGRRTIAFCVDVAHVRDLRDTFAKSGVRAAAITGATPRNERRQILADFATGAWDVVTNCAVLTEGFDDRGVSCVLMARPTASRSLYTQCIGRGLRKAPGKSNCLILDVTDNCEEHKLVTVLDLFGAPNEQNAKGRDVIQVADEDLERAEREHTIASLTPLTWRLASICPWPETPNLKGYAPSAWWHSDTASDKQVKFVRSFGVSVSRELTKGEAHFLIDRCRDFDAAFPKPVSSKQRWCLERAGQWRKGMTRRQATKLIGKLKERVRA